MFFGFGFERPLEPTNALILHLTFGYHQAGYNRPILDSLETVWDRAVSPHSSCAVSEAESSRARRFHRDNTPNPGGHSTFTWPCPQPRGAGTSLPNSKLSLSLLFNSLMFYLKRLVKCLFVWVMCGGRMRWGALLESR